MTVFLDFLHVYLVKYSNLIAFPACASLTYNNLIADISEEWREKMEHFIELPAEICQLKVVGFSKDIGSSLSLLPSIMTRLEGFLVAIELKDKLVASFPEGAEITADRVSFYRISLSNHLIS